MYAVVYMYMYIYFIIVVCVCACVCAGVISMWDTSQNKCIMFWKTALCEIGICVIMQLCCLLHWMWSVKLPSLPVFPSSLGAVWYSSGRLAVGSVSGKLALWGVGGEGGGEKGPPTVSLQTELELNSAIFSLAFDNHMKLVCVHVHVYTL